MVTVVGPTAVKKTVASAEAKARGKPPHRGGFWLSPLVANTSNGTVMAPSVQAQPTRLVTEFFPSKLLSSPVPHANGPARPRLQVPAVVRTLERTIGLTMKTGASANLLGRATLVARTMRMLP